MVHRRRHPQSVGKVQILWNFSELQLLVSFSGDNFCCLRSCKLIFPPQFDIFCPSDFFFCFQMRLLHSEARAPLQQHLAHVPPLDLRMKNTITILKFISKPYACAFKFVSIFAQILLAIASEPLSFIISVLWEVDCSSAPKKSSAFCSC